MDDCSDFMESTYKVMANSFNSTYCPKFTKALQCTSYLDKTLAYIGTDAACKSTLYTLPFFLKGAEYLMLNTDLIGACPQLYAYAWGLLAGESNDNCA